MRKVLLSTSKSIQQVSCLIGDELGKLKAILQEIELLRQQVRARRERAAN